MKSLLMSHLGVQPNRISILPFFEIDFFDDYSDRVLEKPFRFVYPADGVPQKNHSFLFRVWERLSMEHNLAPELHVTLPEKYRLHLDNISKLQQKGVNIINHGFVSKTEMKALYKNAHFLVFPSLSESFGLPLAEAASTGLRVLGAKLPYLFQVVEPSGTFDPADENSLIKLIADLYRGVVLPQTKVVLSDHISELIELIHGNR
jgi:glycosyltransferase involved in cell wall biosynthesis